MSKRLFSVNYKIYGSILVEAEKGEQVLQKIKPLDEELFEKISQSLREHIEIDNIEVYEIDEAIVRFKGEDNGEDNWRK
jgi:hypothetical protein